ncbi:MAG: NYN domain-containing protein [Victivallaceae bacterium]
MKAENETGCYLTTGKVAILIDGGFFLKRINFLCKEEERWDVDYVAKMIRILCKEHSKRLDQQIYRVFYYDCNPLEDGMHNPISEKFVKFRDNQQYRFRKDLFEELRKMRKMALRLGEISINTQCRWTIKPEKMDLLLKKKISVDDLDPESDIVPNLRQKQVDMKIGVDIASMVLKKQVESIILVAGDGDFVPASKMARREGIDFILDPLWANINPALNEHVDGLHSVLFAKKKTTSNAI